MKLSFSLPSKQVSKPIAGSLKNSNGEGSAKDGEKSTAHEYITEFDPSKAPVQKAQNRRIIPPLPNEFRPGKRVRNLDLPLRPSSVDSELHFELETLGDGAASDMHFGLNLRQNSDREAGDSGSQPSARHRDDAALRKLKDDLRRLPDGNTLEDYNECPVEGYSAAILAGYGWFEGKGIGKNAKEDVKIHESKKWTAKEGMGFSSGMGRLKQKTQSSSVVDGHHPKWVSIGNEVRIIGGQEAGSKGKIVDLPGSQSEAPKIMLKLSRSGEKVTLNIHEIAELGSSEEDKCLKQLKNSDGHRERREGTRHVGGNKVKERKAVSWLTSHIRVRIISKGLKGGRLYLKKGEVVDVVGPGMCDIVMDGSKELVQGVDEDALETAMPHRGGQVLVLRGRHKGVLGALVEKDLDAETGVLEDFDSRELLKVRLEQIAEYVGDPSCLNY